MQIIISPSKTMDFSNSMFFEHRLPVFLTKTEALTKILKDYSESDLAKLMKISDRLANQTHESFKNWNAAHKSKSVAAIFAYQGAAFSGFELDTYRREDFEFLDKHLNILSGFYGVLSPCDFIMAYRLELGQKLKLSLGGTTYANLYEYWKKEVNDYLAEKLSANDVLLNLASLEYSKIIDNKRFFMVTVDFRVLKDKKLKTVGIYAKQQRGRMANWIVKNRITDINDIKSYSNDGFEFEPRLTQSAHLLFTKKI